MEEKQNLKRMRENKREKKDFKHLVDATGKVAGSVAQDVTKATADVVDKTKSAAIKSQQAIFNAIDQNGNGEIDIEDIIIMGLSVPGIRINRADFLQSEFKRKYPQHIIDDAIAYNPLHAKIPLEEIDRIADEVIKHERICVSGISAALGTPGGVAMAATIPADIAQYYGYMLRATQKLLYLYGFPEIDTEERGQKFDSETMNILIICMGVMYGAAGANNALKAVAKALASGVEKQLLKKALTKGTIYPIVRSVAKWFSVKMTKELFAGFFKKAIPVVGGILGGSITFFSFKPCCDKLKSSLQNTMLSNPNFCSATENDDLVIIDADIEPDEVIEEKSVKITAETQLYMLYTWDLSEEQKREIENANLGDNLTIDEPLLPAVFEDEKGHFLIAFLADEKVSDDLRNEFAVAKVSMARVAVEMEAVKRIDGEELRLLINDSDDDEHSYTIEEIQEISGISF